jgi:hypothetical protein
MEPSGRGGRSGWSRPPRSSWRCPAAPWPCSGRGRDGSAADAAGLGGDGRRGRPAAPGGVGADPARRSGRRRPAARAGARVGDGSGDGWPAPRVPTCSPRCPASPSGCWPRPGSWSWAPTSTPKAGRTPASRSRPTCSPGGCRRPGPDLALAFLATPTDVFAVPGEAVEHSARAYAERSRTAKLVGPPLRWASRGRLLHRAYRPGADPGICDALVPAQGPNYALGQADPALARDRGARGRHDGVVPRRAVQPHHLRAPQHRARPRRSPAPTGSPSRSSSPPPPTR